MKGANTFRRAIAGQVRAVKKTWPDMVTCARCGETLHKADAHADHTPMPFAAIVRMYLDMATLFRWEITPDHWRAFHLEEASLKPSCAACNIAANPRAKTWTQRRRRAA